MAKADLTAAEKDAATAKTAKSASKAAPATEVVEVVEAVVEAGLAGRSNEAPRLSVRWRPTWPSRCRQGSSPTKA
jgi:hypothetical protein